MENDSTPRFVCDAMLGGLARWLRAAGYDASWRVDITDPDLVRLAHAEGRTLLSCDNDIFQFAIVRDGVQPALFVPLRLSPEEQLAFVLRQLALPLRQPRCMACGGSLVEVPKERAEGRVPPPQSGLGRTILGMRQLRAGLLVRHPLAADRTAVAAGGQVRTEGRGPLFERSMDLHSCMCPALVSQEVVR